MIKMEFKRYVALNQDDYTIMQNNDLTELIRELLSSNKKIGDIKIRALYVDENMNRFYIKI
jgi:hypothetical protein